MSIPLDKLYYYIESVAKEIYNDIVIYRFYPHGAKNIDNLRPLTNCSVIQLTENKCVYCCDQEPLDYSGYSGSSFKSKYEYDLFKKCNVSMPDNIAQNTTIYDNSILVHSEKRSNNLKLYENKFFISVYYWSHAIISLDWFRYARYEKINKSIKKTFLIYNRAWSGSREYRLKFVELLINHHLINKCQLALNPVEPDLNVHYTDHKFINKTWQPTCCLEDFVPTMSTAPSWASADYDFDDYNATEIEVVLETLFDDERLQLTEKILRPIALGQPFILAATHGSLEYLRSYGFKTFATVFDETYDTIEDPYQRLQAVVVAMKEISKWPESEKAKRMDIANQIANYNRKHFFSNKFFNIVTDELRDNLKTGLDKLEHTNTSTRFFARVKELANHKEITDLIFTYVSRKQLLGIFKKAKKYYKRPVLKN